MSNIQTTSSFSNSLQQLVHFTSFKNSATNYIYILAWRSYLRQLQTNPLVTKSITSGIISSLSTILASIIQDSGEGLKSSKVINEFTIGLALRAPLVHYFHTFLDKCLFRNTKQTSPAVIVAKVILDQFIFSPPFTALYYYVTALMRDEPLKPVSQKIRRELFAVMKKSWLLWIPVNAINYALVPLELRVLFANIIDVFWTAYLISTVSSKSK
ncbi:hypothetical protein GpartN1_g6004.t1 [Galdieria partita]|uniref:Peroxisomal membrane MPV17/PMP22-like protein n=1 Tax=Galdieria partita TaxID=83374 RepID=A0A9C7USU9_9RHOD|nr:hypothetical protein GpartN1_g6004.t1 [Galdieria partita]